MTHAPASPRGVGRHPSPVLALAITLVIVAGLGACSAPSRPPEAAFPLVPPRLPTVVLLGDDTEFARETPPVAARETRNYSLRLASLPLATVSLRTEAADRGRRSLSLAARAGGAAALFTDRALQVDVVVTGDRRPLRAVAVEHAGEATRRTLLAFDDGTGSVVVKETQEDRSRVCLVQADTPWEPLSFVEAVAHLPFESGAPRSFDLIVGRRLLTLTVRHASETGSSGHFVGSWRPRDDHDDEGRSPPADRSLPTDLEAWFDVRGQLARAVVATPFGSLELARAD